MLTETNERWHYVFVCADLKPEQQLVQACHAAYEAGCRFGAPGENGNLVLCSVDDQEALMDVASSHGASIPLTVFVEPDYGEPRVTALATAPLTDKERKPLRHHRLWRLPVEQAPICPQCEHAA